MVLENDMQYFHQGNTCFKQKLYEKAMLMYQRALELNSKHGDSWLNLGNTYTHLNRYEEAEKAYTHCLTCKIVDSSYVYCNRAQARRYLHDFSGALDDYCIAIKINPSVASFFVARGNLQLYLNAPLQAIVDYTQAINLKSDYVEAYYNRALAYQSVKNVAAAKQDLQKVLYLKGEIS